MTLTPQHKKIIKWVGIPALYLFALAMFAYAAFPYDRLKDRLVMGFNASQSGPDASRIEIDDLSWSWRFPGFSATGIRMIGPEPKGAAAAAARKAAKPAPSASAAAPGEDAESSEDEDDKPTPRKGVIEIGDLHARIAPLSLLFGTKQVSFGGDAFGGELDGEVALATDETRFELELEDIEAGSLPGVKDMVGLPLAGQLQGTVTLLLPEGKASKAEGDIELQIENLEVGDGHAKVLNAISLPKIEAGTLKLSATITAGRLKIKEFTCDGQDLELDADGQLRLRDALMQSVADLTVSFKFSDRYKTKNDLTKGLFGDPGSNVPGLFDVNPQVKRALGKDGFYTWKATGALSKLRFNPAADKRVRTGARSDDKSGTKLAKTPAKTMETRTNPQRTNPPPRPPTPARTATPKPRAPTPPRVAPPTPARMAQSRAATGSPPRAVNIPQPEPEQEEAEEEEEDEAEEPPTEQESEEEEVSEEEASEEEQEEEGDDDSESQEGDESEDQGDDEDKEDKEGDDEEGDQEKPEEDAEEEDEEEE